MIIVATTSLPAVTARTPHARAKMKEYFMSYVLLRKRRWNKKKRIKDKGKCIRKFHNKLNETWFELIIVVPNPKALNTFWVQRSFGYKNWMGKKNWGKKNPGPIILAGPTNRPFKYDDNWIRKSWDIHEFCKGNNCAQRKYCIDEKKEVENRQK